MEQLHEWQRELRAQLERIAQQMKEYSQGIDKRIPTLSSPVLEPQVQKIEDGLTIVFQKIESGIRKLVDLMVDLAETKQEDVSGLLHAMSDMVMVASVVMKDMKPSLKILAKGETIQSVLGVSDSTLNSLYDFSCYLYENQHYEEASGAFCLLALLNPSYMAFWLGLGNCEYLLRRYQEALLAYTFASEVSPADPLPQILMAKSHIGLGNFVAAKATLSMMEMSADTASLEKCKNQIESIKIELRRSPS